MTSKPEAEPCSGKSMAETYLLAIRCPVCRRRDFHSGLVRGHQTDPRMVMVLVVPVEELAAEASGVLDTAETFWEARLILQGLEVAFRKRVVVGRVRAVMRPGDAEVSEQERGGFRLHWAAAIGVQRELTGRHVMFFDRIVEQRLEQGGRFRIRHTPADHAAAEDVEDHIEIKVGSYGVDC